MDAQEDMFRDIAASDKEWRILLLRYFNPVAAHPSGELGEHPVGIPNNLMPYIQQVTLKDARLRMLAFRPKSNGRVPSALSCVPQGCVACRAGSLCHLPSDCALDWTFRGFGTAVLLCLCGCGVQLCTSTTKQPKISAAACWALCW